MTQAILIRHAETLLQCLGDYARVKRRDPDCIRGNGGHLDESLLTSA